MSDLFTSADQRKRERVKDELLTHCALVLTKALKQMKGHGIIENTVRKEIRETLKKVKAA